MQPDIERWNRKYREGNFDTDRVPDPLLQSCAHLLAGHGVALDVACGLGHNAIFLAELGYEVIAVDGSIVALTKCRDALQGKHLSVHLIAADLERFSLPREYFDVVLVIRYLHRPLIAQLRQALKPGGLVIYKTFNTNISRERPGFNREHLLERGELRQLFSGFADGKEARAARQGRRDCGFELIETNDSDQIEENETWLVARKPAA